MFPRPFFDDVQTSEIVRRYYSIQTDPDTFRGEPGVKERDRPRVSTTRELKRIRDDEGSRVVRTVVYHGGGAGPARPCLFG